MCEPWITRDKNMDNCICQFLCLNSYRCLFKGFREVLQKLENVCFCLSSLSTKQWHSSTFYSLVILLKTTQNELQSRLLVVEMIIEMPNLNSYWNPPGRPCHRALTWLCINTRVFSRDGRFQGEHVILIKLLSHWPLHGFCTSSDM